MCESIVVEEIRKEVNPEDLSFNDAYNKALEQIALERKRKFVKSRESLIFTYSYGVKKTRKGEFQRFKSHKREVPYEAVVVCRKRMTVAESRIESRAFYAQFILESADAASVYDLQKEAKNYKCNIGKGEVVSFIDDDRNHTAIVLEYTNELCCLLFVTSNPYWNTYSRLVTEDELAILGYTNSKRDSYFAPVIRPTKFVHSKNHSFPQHRIESLLEEFGVEKFATNL